MNDKELYRQILGISGPWEVAKVDLNIEDEKVDIEIIYKSNKALCQECGTECDIYDHSGKRAWRHSNTCQMKTYLTCNIPRIKCKLHGLKTIKVPWSESSSRPTILFE
ncbi:MAG: transposase family protein [Calditrichaeota bacterium]|nr:transposase family protein [Calditrichota bacterium]